MAFCQGISSIFVNNIPDIVDSRWLFGIFEKCGAIEEVYIPFKRNRGGRKFDFIRYKEEGSAVRAVKTFNRVWLLDHSLGVNMARFNRGVEHTSLRQAKTMGKQVSDVAVGAPQLQFDKAENYCNKKNL